MTDINAKLDTIENQQRIKLFLTLFLILVAISFYFLPPLGKQTEISGEVIKLFGVPTVTGEKLYLIVRLKDGQKVKTRIQNSAFYKKGETVILLQVESIICCSIVYRFQGYEKLKHNK